MHESAGGTRKRSQNMPPLGEINAQHAALSEVNKIAGHGEINDMEGHCNRRTWRNNDIAGQGKLNKRSSRINSKILLDKHKNEVKHATSWGN
jgi:hypothetical protein